MAPWRGSLGLGWVLKLAAWCAGVAGSQGKKDSEAEVEERKRKAADVLKRLERRKQGLPTDEEEEGGEDFDPEQLRQWELQKLRYYFAVAEFDTTVTASAVYEQVDGIEFEYSSVQVRPHGVGLWWLRGRLGVLLKTGRTVRGCRKQGERYEK